MPTWGNGAKQAVARRAEWLSSQTFVVLAAQVPKKNDKTPQSAEQFFAALHGIYRNDPVIQEYLGFEIVARKDSITFYIFTPIHLRDFIEGQLYAQYPGLTITQVPDYTRDIDLSGKHVAVTKLNLEKTDVYPIKTYAGTDIDPLASITGAMATLELGEQIWLQILARPVGVDWQNRAAKFVSDTRAGKAANDASTGTAGMVGRFMLEVAREMYRPGTGAGGVAGKPAEPPKLSAAQEAGLKGVEQKMVKQGYETMMRLTVISHTEVSAKSRVLAMVAAIKQYNAPNLNGFMSGEVMVDNYPSWEAFVTRSFEEKGGVLNIEELASVFHFPTEKVETSAIAWSGSKKGEAPFNLPLKSKHLETALTILGKTDYRDQAEEFGIKVDDRRRHTYIVGKSGVGKSVLLENMIINDIAAGRGVIVIDPHGELADKVLECIPENRIDDVIVFDPADREFPIAFNVLEVEDEDFRGTVASGFVGIFKKMFGNSWGPRLEHILRNTVLALLESPNPTMLGIPRMLTDAAFRNQILGYVKDPVIKDFWIKEWGSMDQKLQVEAMGPVLNKVGQFLSSTMVRNIIGQPKSKIDIRRIMDEQKILIVNLSKGKIGEDNMALLGAMFVTKTYLAAMSRANVAAGQRPDCFLYVDEFQNFATDSFANILAESRKYNLALTMAHQYVDQLADEVKSAVIGNVGTIITFRVGAPDAAFLSSEFAPAFEAGDLINLPRAHIYIKLMIDGLVAPAFSATTLPPRDLETGTRLQVVEQSRAKYALTRKDAEEVIDEGAGYRQRREVEDAAEKAKQALMRAAAEREQATKAGEIAKPVDVVKSVELSATPSPATSPEREVPVYEQKPNTSFSVPEPKLAPVVEEGRVEPPTPVVVEREVTQPTSEPIIPQQSRGEGEEMESGKPKKRKPRVQRPLKIIGEWAYKEASQRGGDRWFIGEPADVARARFLERQQKQNGDTSPASTE